jgi:hypothetical protein
MKTQSVKVLEQQHDRVHALDMPETEKLDTLEGIEGEMIIAEENENRLLAISKLEGWDQTMIFTDKDTLDLLLSQIDEAARSILWDVSTSEGRKLGASIANKVSKSKVVADKAGKSLTDDWAKKKAAVDGGRKKLRIFCDELRDDIKAPIEAWKAEEARKVAEVKLAEEFAADHEEALQRDDLYNREAVVREAEAKIAADKLEVELKAQEEVDKANAKAREDKAAEAAVKAERVRVLDEDARQRTIDKARSRNKEHRRKINQSIVTKLVAAGVEEDTAKVVVTAIATGMIPSVIIQY